jgi:hypothetical protein
LHKSRLCFYSRVVVFFSSFSMATANSCLLRQSSPKLVPDSTLCQLGKRSKRKWRGKGKRKRRRDLNESTVDTDLPQVERPEGGAFPSSRGQPRPFLLESTSSSFSPSPFSRESAYPVAVAVGRLRHPGRRLLLRGGEKRERTRRKSLFSFSFLLFPRGLKGQTAV